MWPKIQWSTGWLGSQLSFFVSRDAKNIKNNERFKNEWNATDWHDGNWLLKQAKKAFSEQNTNSITLKYMSEKMKK